MGLDVQSTPSERYPYPQITDEFLTSSDVLWDTLVTSGIPLTMEDLGKLDVNGGDFFVLFDAPQQERGPENSTGLKGFLAFSGRRGYVVGVCDGIPGRESEFQSSQVQSRFPITEETIAGLNIRARRG